MKLSYSSPVVFGVVTAGSVGMANRFQGGNMCCGCTGHGNSRA